jgi:thiol reductant ABC exporter CydC subunit
MTSRHDRAARTGLGWTLRAARPRAFRLASAALAGAGAYGSSVALLATSAWLISSAALHPPVVTLTVAIVSVRALGISRGVLRYLERLLGHDAALRLLSDVRVTVFGQLARLAPAGLGGTRSGDVLARMVDDVDGQQDFLLRGLVPAGAAAVVATATVGVLTWLLPAAGVVVLLALLAGAVLAPAVAALTAARSERRVAPAQGELGAEVVELLQAAPELIAYGAAERRLGAVRAQDAAVGGLLRRSNRSAALGAGLAAASGGAAVLGCLLVGVPAVRSGRLDGVLLAVVVLTPLALWEVVGMLVPAAQYLPRWRAAAARLAALAATPSPVLEPECPAPLPRTAETRVRVRGLAARWPDTDSDAVRGLNLDLRSSLRVALVGASGSGKSTVIAALLRFLQPSAGTITVNGTDVRAVPSDQIRERFAWCGPDAYLFDSTVRQNLLLAKPDATADELAAAVRAARLDGWLARQPDGLDTRVGEHGGQVSGGERQRIALARALLADRPVLLLDEPTAHLDGTTSDEITADLAAATTGRTTLLVTHRTAGGMPGVDEVVVLPTFVRS